MDRPLESKRKRRSDVGLGLPALQNPELRAKRSRERWASMSPEEREEQVRKASEGHGKTRSQSKGREVLGDRQGASRYRVVVDSRHFKSGEIISPGYVGPSHAIVRRGRTRREIPLHHIEKVEESRMISFRQFLAEMPYYTELDKNEVNRQMGRVVHSDKDEDTKEFPWRKIGSIRDHEVHERRFPAGKTFAAKTYRVVHPETKKVVLELDTQDHQGGEQATMISGVKNSPIKGHELYHHLVTEHGIRLHSDTSQTPGSVSIWKKLHRMPGLKVSHHDEKTGTERPLHTGDNWGKNYGYNSYFRAEKT